MLVTQSIAVGLAGPDMACHALLERAPGSGVEFSLFRRGSPPGSKVRVTENVSFDDGPEDGKTAFCSKKTRSSLALVRLHFEARLLWMPCARAVCLALTRLSEAAHPQHPAAAFVEDDWTGASTSEPACSWGAQRCSDIGYDSCNLLEAAQVC